MDTVANHHFIENVNVLSNPLLYKGSKEVMLGNDSIVSIAHHKEGILLTK